MTVYTDRFVSSGPPIATGIVALTVVPNIAGRTVKEVLCLL